jgi:hypothetical protein
MKKLLLALLLVVFTGVSAFAQNDRPLDPAAEPDHGAASLASGFTPDPFRSPRLTGGGSVDASTRDLGSDCVGGINVQPDFRITAGEFPLLRFIYIADTITADATLIVRDPNGQFYCNNNAFGLQNPLVDVAPAVPGDYAIWIGAFVPGGEVFGELYVTTNNGIVPGSTGLLLPLPNQPSITPPTTGAATPATTVLDPSRVPAGGSYPLAAGFLPDPYFGAVIGGGDLDVSSVGENCAGYAGAAPDFQLDWSGISTRLRFLYLPAQPSDADTGLIVLSPDGQWNCNADFAPGFKRPLVEFIQPVPGPYRIWVTDQGAPNTTVTGLLYVTERTVTPETIRQADSRAFENVNGLTPGGAVQASLFEADTSDPYAVTGVIASDGGVDVTALNPEINQPDPNRGCEGFFTAAPTYTFEYLEAAPFLRLFFVADDAAADTTLVVRMPNGGWYCGDDSFDTSNPTVNIIGNFATGLVDVWVGTYTAGTQIPGTLVVTRGGADPTNPERPSGYVAPSEPIVADTTSTGMTEEPSVGSVVGSIEAMEIVDNPLALNLGAPPHYGTVSLSAGFLPDPHTVSIYSGGTIDSSLIDGACVGTISPEPDYRLEWTGAGGGLRLFFTPNEAGDTTLVIFGPDARFHCNDDSVTSQNPLVDFASAPSGTYYIWVGSFEPGTDVLGQLSITEDLTLSP